MPIRAAKAEDAPRLAALRVRTWREAYRHMIPSAYLGSLSSAADELRWRARLDRRDDRVLVWEQDGRLDGFVVFGAVHDSDPDAFAAGQIYALYVAPDHWREGVGKALLQGAIRDLATAGLTQGVLWVLRDNVRARAFYEALGLRPDGGAKIQDRGDGILLHQVRYSWRQTGPQLCDHAG